MVDKPARVVWLFAREDESMARELLRLSAVLERQGLIESWSGVDIEPGREWQKEIDDHLRRADIVMVLVSPALLASEVARSELELARLYGRHIVPVLMRSAILPPELSSLQALPRDGRSISVRRDRDEALLEVIEGLQQVIAFRTPRQEMAVQIRETRPVADTLTINDIFRLNGPPSVTFVEPPKFGELKLELRTMGTGLVVEGPSKIGKSTAVKKAMEALGVPVERQIWWLGQAPMPFDDFERDLDALLAETRDRWLFIDDFHYLEDPRYLRTLAFRMKALADQALPHAKVTLIGINPLGASLVQSMPDLAGRFRIMRIDRDKDWRRSAKVAELIIQGEQAANIRFSRREEFILASDGNFFIAQFLCNRAAVQVGVDKPAAATVQIDLGPPDVIEGINDELAARYRPPMLDLASFDRSPGPRGAGLSLLWLLSRSSEGFVAIKEARLRFPQLAEAFDWYLESNLTRCFADHPSLKGLLYFNRATGTLTMEDPQLKFFLRTLNWAEFAEASGHGQVSFHPQDGPLWSTPVAVVAGTATPESQRLGVTPVGSEPPRRILHLSDLHFATPDQSTIAYAQLAADLRQLGCDSLDAVFVTGDLANRALPVEYDAARLFFEQLMSGFSLSPRGMVFVPGNHDVSWTHSQSAYTLRKVAESAQLVPGTFIQHTPEIVEVRDEEAYRRRFEPFAEFHRQLTGNEYPLEYAAQGLLFDLPDAGLCVLGLNSAWEIDHHFKERVSIHMNALANALIQLGPPANDSRLRVAMFHHPIHSDEDSRLRDVSFLDQLAVAGFRIILHGHIHKSESALYRYDQTLGGRRMEIIGAGTFGAPMREWAPGYPLQYNLLLRTKSRVTVETRRRLKLGGAWEPDAMWKQGPGRDPLPRYEFDL